MKEDKSVKEIQDLSQKFFQLLDGQVKVSVSPEEELVKIQAETADPGVLIGYHGERLYALQFLLSLMVFRKLGEWRKVVVDVGDYRIKREEALERMALSAAQKVKFAQEEYLFPPMPAAERRVIHLVLSTHPDVLTESRGEGRDRYLVVIPKK